MSRERRRRSRVHVQVPVFLVYDGHQIQGELQDVSLKGLACTVGEMVPLGQECQVILALASGLRIHAKGRVVRVDAQEAAVDFVRLSEKDFAHLRNLVRLYAEDADEVDHELRTPAFGQDPSS